MNATQAIRLGSIGRRGSRVPLGTKSLLLYACDVMRRQDFTSRGSKLRTAINILLLIETGGFFRGRRFGPRRGSEVSRQRSARPTGSKADNQSRKRRGPFRRGDRSNSATPAANQNCKQRRG